MSSKKSHAISDMKPFRQNRFRVRSELLVSMRMISSRKRSLDFSLIAGTLMRIHIHSHSLKDLRDFLMRYLRSFTTLQKIVRICGLMLQKTFSNLWPAITGATLMELFLNLERYLMAKKNNKDSVSSGEKMLKIFKSTLQAI